MVASPHPAVAAEPAQRATTPPIRFRDRLHRSSKRYRDGTHRAQAPAATFKRIRPHLQRAGVTRIADVTGLDHVGVPTTLALRPNALTIACSSGKGLTFEQALVSGAMEAFELHAAETALLPSLRAPYRQIARDHPVPPVEHLPLTRQSLFSTEWPFDWHLGWDLVTQREVAVPLAMVGMSRTCLGSSIGAFQVSSNGLGAGNSFLEAVSSGLCEAIERDAVACHTYAAMYKDHAIPVVPDDVLSARHPGLADVLEKCERAGVGVLVEDCTADTMIPTYAAFVYDRVDRGVGVTRGSGTHLDPAIAAIRAVTEALQARLNFIAGSRDDIFRTAFVRSRLDWSRAVEAVEHDRRHNPTTTLPPSRAADSFETDVSELLHGVRAAGLDHVVVVDITPEGFPIHIVRVVVPGFEGYMHHGYQPGVRALHFEPAGAGR